MARFWFMIWVCTCNFSLSILVIVMLSLWQMQIWTVLNSLSPSNNASKYSHKLCYSEISFIVLLPGRPLLACKDIKCLKILHQNPNINTSVTANFLHALINWPLNHFNEIFWMCPRRQSYPLAFGFKLIGSGPFSLQQQVHYDAI